MHSLLTLLQHVLRVPGRPSPLPPPRAAVAPQAPAPAAAAAGDAGWPFAEVQQGRPAYLAWLLALPRSAGAAQPSPGALVLSVLDRALATQDACARLLRRAPNVVPRLLNTLRSDIYARAEVAELIERDPVLMAEVLRTARSVLYAHHHHGSPSVAQAVGLLGSEGLRQVIARVLVRPLFSADAGGLQARAAPRLWDESERAARLCVALGRETGLDAVDAYLAGLLHNVGWSALLHAVHAAGLAQLLDRGLLETPGLAAALCQRRDRVLALLLPTWDISPALNALAGALGDADAPPHPLLAVLAQAQDLLVLRRQQIVGDVPGGLALPPGLPAWVRPVYCES